MLKPLRFFILNFNCSRTYSELYANFYPESCTYMLKLAGLLTYLYYFTFPSLNFKTVVLKKIITSLIEVALKQFQHRLTVAGTAQEWRFYNYDFRFFEIFNSSIFNRQSLITSPDSLLIKVENNSTSNQISLRN